MSKLGRTICIVESAASEGQIEIGQVPFLLAERAR
jgi:hypothetical protein